MKVMNFHCSDSQFAFFGVLSSTRHIVVYPHLEKSLDVLRYHSSPATRTRWWFQIFFIFSPKIGEDSHFDEHIFQMGWFNHQPENFVNNGINYLPTGAGVLPSTVSYLSKLGGSKNDL